MGIHFNTLGLCSDLHEAAKTYKSVLLTNCCTTEWPFLLELKSDFNNYRLIKVSVKIDIKYWSIHFYIRVTCPCVSK